MGACQLSAGKSPAMVAGMRKRRRALVGGLPSTVVRPRLLIRITILAFGSLNQQARLCPLGYHWRRNAVSVGCQREQTNLSGAMDNRFLIIIDGYNLIFQCGLEGRTRSPATLEKARFRLVSELVTYLDESDRDRTAVVFDAKRLPIKEDSAVSNVAGVTVYYAIEFDEADTMIEGLIERNSVPKQLTIVSSDHRLHKAALRRKATPVDSDVWYERLKTSRRPGPNSGGEPARGVDAKSTETKDVAHLDSVDWISEFGLDENPIEDVGLASPENLSVEINPSETNAAKPVARGKKNPVPNRDQKNRKPEVNEPGLSDAKLPSPRPQKPSASAKPRKPAEISDDDASLEDFFPPGYADDILDQLMGDD
ncbi:MAG: putative RNA-binding protein with PIN domain [Mariniblastus sp.]|jgi:predicted RNA-binding protein with PIN domain